MQQQTDLSASGIGGPRQQSSWWSLLALAPVSWWRVSALLQAEVNIVQAYPILDRDAVALMVDNIEMAQETLGSKGFTMLTEDDLSDSL